VLRKIHTIAKEFIGGVFERGEDLLMSEKIKDLLSCHVTSRIQHQHVAMVCKLKTIKTNQNDLFVLFFNQK